MAYLQAMGVDSYVSRAQVPGAAPTRRLAIVPAARTASGNSAHAPTAEGRIPKVGSPGPDAIAAAPPIPRLVDSHITAGRPVAPATGSVTASAKGRVTTGASAVAPFSMSVIIAGGVLWLEDLEGRALAREQVQLVQAMSRALAVAGSGTRSPAPGAVPVDVSQFDWPMHNNRQLGLGKDAAAASLAGFLGRRLENNCYGLVLLGKGACSLVPLEQLECSRVVATSSTARMLSSPELKRKVWQDLSPLLDAG